MNIKLLAHVIASPEVSYYFGALLDRVSDHLRARHLSSILHHESAHIFGASFVKTQNPHPHLLATLATMRKLRLIDLDSSALLTKLVLGKVILRVVMYQLAHSSIHIVHVSILQTFQSELG
jgi:hypothetical protein